MSILSLKESILNEKLNAFPEDFLFDSVLNCISDGVVIADQAGKFVFWNSAAEDIVGLGHSDAQPSEWSNYYGCLLPDRVTPFPTYDLPLTKAIRGTSSKNTEMFIRNKNRNGSYINIQGKPIKNESGLTTGGIIVFKGVNKTLEVNSERKKKYELEFKSSEHLKHVFQSDTFSKLFDFEPLSKIHPDIFNKILSSYENLIILSTTIKERDWKQEITSELSILAKKLVFLKASPADLADLHNLAIRKSLSFKSEYEIEVLIEYGRRMSLELMGLIVSYYRNNSIKLNRSTEFNAENLKSI